MKKVNFSPRELQSYKIALEDLINERESCIFFSSIPKISQ